MCPARMAKLESAMRVVLAFEEAFNRQDISGMLALMGDDCIIESATPAPHGTRYSGKSAVEQYWQEFFLKSSRSNIEIEEIFCSGEHCVVRWNLSRENLNRQEGYFRGVDIFLVRKGSILEMLSYVKE